MAGQYLFYATDADYPVRVVTGTFINPLSFEMEGEMYDAKEHNILDTRNKCQHCAFFNKRACTSAPRCNLFQVVTLVAPTDYMGKIVPNARRISPNAGVVTQDVYYVKRPPVKSIPVFNCEL